MRDIRQWRPVSTYVLYNVVKAPCRIRWLEQNEENAERVPNRGDALKKVKGKMV
jgi:hypothetical protein